MTVHPSRRVALCTGAAGVVLGLGLGAWGARWTSSKPRRLRPPGAGDEKAFLAACLRCGQCVDACPFDTLKLDVEMPGLSAGTPFLEPRTEPCWLCPDEDELLCIEACPSDALQPVDQISDIRMGVARIDEGTCFAYNGVSCRACWHACPFPDVAIRLGPRLRPAIDPDGCIGCGLCDHACLVEPSAIPVIPKGGAA